MHRPVLTNKNKARWWTWVIYSCFMTCVATSLIIGYAAGVPQPVSLPGPQVRVLCAQRAAQGMCVCGAGRVGLLVYRAWQGGAPPQHRGGKCCGNDWASHALYTQASPDCVTGAV